MKTGKVTLTKEEKDENKAVEKEDYVDDRLLRDESLPIGNQNLIIYRKVPWVKRVNQNMTTQEGESMDLCKFYIKNRKKFSGIASKWTTCGWVEKHQHEGSIENGEGLTRDNQ